MPFLRCSLVSFLLVFCMPAGFAQAHIQHKTDAQFDGFSGPVKSVSSFSTYTGVKWEQPGGLTMVEPIWCRDCRYDPDGSKTVSGEVAADGKFYGETTSLLRDDKGNVSERFSYSSITGQLQRHVVMGPFGRIEEWDYVSGKLEIRSTFGYDQNGNQNEWRTFDGKGSSTGYTLRVSADDGSLLRSSAYDKNGHLSHEQTYDPATDTEHFTFYDEGGRVKVAWTVVKGRLTSFWEPNDSPSQFGDNFTEPMGEGKFDNFACHNDLRCDVSHIQYEYLDGDKRTPKSAEWHDADGRLQLGAYFEYQVDSHHNWTSRRVWVWNPELGERTLSEVDSRVITYWK